MAAVITAEKKLRKDLMNLNKEPRPGISALPTEENILCWDAIIFGPFDTPFEDGIFKLKLQFPNDCPISPPMAHFTAKMFHPNVYDNGKNCIDILQCRSKWSPDYDVGNVLVAIQVLLGEPNPDSPANSEAKRLFVEDLKAYEKRVKEIVALSINDE